MGHGDGKDDPGGGNSIVVRIRREGDDNFSVVDGDDGRMDHDSDNEDRLSNENGLKEPTQAELNKTRQNPENREFKKIERNVNLKYRTTDIGPYVVYVEHNTLNVGRVHPMKLGGLLRDLQWVKNEITEICRVGRNRLKIVLKTALAANSLVREKLFSDNELTAYIPQHLTEKKAIVRGVEHKADRIPVNNPN
jgi:hypothetical protein